MVILDYEFSYVPTNVFDIKNNPIVSDFLPHKFWN